MAYDNPLYNIPGLAGYLAQQQMSQQKRAQDRAMQIENMKLADMFNAQLEKRAAAEQNRALGGTMGFIQAESAPDDVQRQTQSAIMQQGTPADRSAVIKQMVTPPKSEKPNISTTAKELVDEGFVYGTPEFGQEMKRRYEAKLKKDGGDKAPTTRVIQSGNKKITQEWVDGKWNNVAEGAEKTPAQLFKEEQDARKIATQEEKADKLKETAITKAKIVINKANDALKKTGFFTTGLTGAVLSKIPGRAAYDVDKTIDTIKANIGFQELADMRAASPTGGALGQVAVKELEFLQATIASLDSGLSYEEKVKVLDQVKTHYQNWLDAVEGRSSPNTQPPLPNGGVDIHSEADKILGL